MTTPTSNQRLWPDSEQILRHQYEFLSLSRQPVPGSEIVGPAELRKREHENKTGGAPPTFRVPFTFASSPLSESLATESQTFPLAKRPPEAMSEEKRLFSQ